MASAEANIQEGFNSMSSEIDKILSGNGGSESPDEPQPPKETIEESKNSRKEFTAPKTEVADSKGNKVVISGGYYIARYEASYASGSSIEDYKAASKKSIANSKSSMNYTAGTLWNFISELDASKVSINTYPLYH